MDGWQDDLSVTIVISSLALQKRYRTFTAGL